ncbi:hypothetical protein B5P46_11730 [Rhizobium leguminosarum]|uniref:Uncharacterized protein n=1 Tax=Rhizobium leguminosarum TaxID=384 RepID=A0A4Q1UE88_RHILE|nr:hypothetical protein [Rhizobium leguminosarum]RXT29345.1 hypothetical protein B5P46_11730 [Rhizobium leguminosarum]
MSASKNLLDRLIQIIEEKTDAVPPLKKEWDSDDHRRYHAAAERILEELVAEEAATVGTRFDGTSLKMAGIKTSSTSGAWGALANWKNAAQRRIDEGRAL